MDHKDSFDVLSERVNDPVQPVQTTVQSYIEPICNSSAEQHRPTTSNEALYTILDSDDIGDTNRLQTVSSTSEIQSADPVLTSPVSVPSKNSSELNIEIPVRRNPPRIKRKPNKLNL